MVIAISQDDDHGETPQQDLHPTTALNTSWLDSKRRVLRLKLELGLNGHLNQNTTNRKVSLKNLNWV